MATFFRRGGGGGFLFVATPATFHSQFYVFVNTSIAFVCNMPQINVIAPSLKRAFSWLQQRMDGKMTAARTAAPVQPDTARRPPGTLANPADADLRKAPCSSKVRWRML